MDEPRSKESPMAAGQAGDFRHYPLAPGLDFYFAHSDLFKTFTIQAVLHCELGPDATAFALLPMVLRRGTRDLPTMQALTRFLDDLYGTSLEMNIHKRGERHMAFFRLALPGPAFVPDGRETLHRGCRFLGDLFSMPRLEGKAFPADVVAQEKANLARHIISLVNHREAYAIVRAIREMCHGERYAEYEYGKMETLRTLTAGSLHDFWIRTIRTRPITLFAVGDADGDETAEILAEAFRWDREPGAPPPGAERKPAPEVPRRVEERFPLRQEWLVQGYRLEGPTTGDRIPALLFFNGILGGFAFARLFKRVREAEGLAYEVFSFADSLKGVLFVAAGVRPGAADRVIKVIGEELASLQAGEIGAHEMESARNLLLAEVRALVDSPGQKITAVVEGLLQDRLRTVEEMKRDVDRVSVEDVSRMAACARLDTTFLLLPEGGEGAEP